ncbi:MAG: AMP-dependent synthetase/ligase [Nocardioidaceae bacterium]
MGRTAEVSARHTPALDAATVCEAFQLTVAACGDRPALRTKGDAWACSWRDYGERVRRIAAGLAALGVRRGDTVALMLPNRPEFHLVDAAAMHLGAAPFSIYNTYAPAEIEYLVRDAGSRVAIGDSRYVDRLLAVRGGDNALEDVVVVDGDAPAGAMTLAALEAHGDPGFDFEAAWRAVRRDDVLTLIYTSGTTGPPKGVELTHRNLFAAADAYDRRLGIPDGGRIVSYLPMAHIAERAVSHYLPMVGGMTVTACPDAREMLAYLPEVRPTWFFGVPRIWEKLKAGLEAMLAGLPDEAQRARIEAALELALRRVRALGVGEAVEERLERDWAEADASVLAPVRAMLGLDEATISIVAAAPTAPAVVEFFLALGIPLSELWGMSETTATGACNPPGRIKVGTVGPPMPGVEMELADDGEILVRGPVVMAGYRNQPDETRKAFSAEGWLLTGDIGQLDDDGYLRIVDRKKELIINAAGKNMSPANIEMKLKTAGPLIGQAVAIGDRRPYNVALLTLDPDGATALARELGLEGRGLAELARDERVVAAVRREVDRANAELARVEQIKRFELLPTDWQPGGDELTPTLKLRRRPIAKKYAREIEALYGG